MPRIKVKTGLKNPMTNLGKPSCVNGLPKLKIIAPHVKKTVKGYKVIKPYPRSK